MGHVWGFLELVELVLPRGYSVTVRVDAVERVDVNVGAKARVPQERVRAS